MIRTRLIGALAGLSFLAAPALAQTPAFTPDQKAAIGVIVKEYLLANPDLMKDVFAALEKKESEAQAAAQAKVLSEKGGMIASADKAAVLGNPQGDVTLVEFVDYNCGYCRRAHKDVEALIKADPKLRVIVRELPVLGPGSIEASQISAQLHTDPKFPAFYSAMFAQTGRVGKAEALATAKALGLDTAALEANMRAKATAERIEESHQLANALNIGGTPTYVIGGEVVPGAVGLDALKKRVEAMRSCGKSAC